MKALEEILHLEGLNPRRYPRHLTDIPTEITSKQSGKGMITDMSLVGCWLITAMPLAVGEIVELSFPLPKQCTTVRLEGRVRRVQREHEETWAGVEFTGLSEHTTEALQTFFTLPLRGKGR